MRRCVPLFLGRVDYAAATRLQDRCARRLKDGMGEEQLLLLEHPPVFTLGRNARDQDVLADDATRARLGIALERTDRGGQVTYHGPGQLVGYPILDLSPDRRDVFRYLRDLEEVLIRTLGRFGIGAGRSAGLTGVWAGGAKIASIGVHLSRWVTTHGFALNVSTDLSRFGLIVPCGLRRSGVTSMERLGGRVFPLEEVAAALVPEFAARFGRVVPSLVRASPGPSVPDDTPVPAAIREAS
ncbi:MAG: lipoyl(octanoyl) transferase LipB [Candidatus Polarisedimenticolia bacterium]